jgi:hypothetical protein
MLPIRVPFHNEHIKLKSGVVKTIIQWVEEILEKRGVEL